MTQPVKLLWGPAVLGEREELLREAEAIGHIGTWAWDMRSGEVAWSAELYRILGRAAGVDVATFDNFIASIDPDDRSAVSDLSQRAMQGDVAERADFRVQRPDGSIREVMGLAQIFRDDQAVPHRMVGAIIDLTDRRLLEGQLIQSQKMEALGRFAGGIAHDFNNLLTVILLNLQMLRSSGGVRGRLEEVHDAANHAAALTAQLVAFSRRTPQPPVRIDVNAVVHAARALVERLIGEDIDVSFTPTAEAPAVLAPHGQLEQVLMNLAVNARDAMPTGGRLGIRTVVERRGAKEFVRLSVTDTGSGMDAQTRSRIFEPFFTTKEAGKGTGLGLATVFGIVSQCGGVVEVESEVGHGSTFHVLVPRCDEPAPASRDSTPVAPSGERGTILLVEDEPAVLATVANVLREGGYDVLPAGRPSEALALWRAHRARIVLLLCDIVMPEMDGRALATKLREDAPTLPIVLMTGYDPDAGEPAPANSRLLAKPFAPDELLRTITRATGPAPARG